jgi:membrane protein implicated in regulation of membrane protease activity
MSNALFITGLAVFFHVWGGAKLGTALAQVTTHQFNWQILSAMIGGALLAFVPFVITGPTWRILDQPSILAGEMVILLLAIGIPMFVPIRYREAAFGPKTYLTWLGIGLILCGVYLLFQPRELATCVGLSVLIAGMWCFWRGIRPLRKP